MSHPDPAPQPPAAAGLTPGTEGGALKRGLTNRHIQFIALGSAIGTGLFYGSAAAISMAGPAVLLVYLVAGLAVFMVMRALGEMAVRHPIPGSFGQYAARYLGPFAGYVTGWTFVFEMAVVAIADVTAFAVYMSFWFPGTPAWIWISAVILFIGAINTRNVKTFGELEFWLSSIKVLAIIAMIVGGIALMIMGVSYAPDASPGPHNLFDHGGFMPEGAWGLLASLSVVVFAFGGIETIGITAGESDDPDRTIPRAINAVPFRILLFYVMALGVIMSLVPWDTIDGETSPFVQIFDALGVPWAPSILNVVVITAAISAINADTYGAGRVLFGLAQQGHAPRAFASVSRTGVPWLTVLGMLLVLALGAVLNTVMSDVFTLIASIATFATVWVWLMILLSHIAMRREIAIKGRPESAFRVPLWPVASWTAVVFVAVVIVVLGIVPDTRLALVVGVVWLLLLGLGYLLIRGRGHDRPDLDDRTSLLPHVRGD